MPSRGRVNFFGQGDTIMEYGYKCYWDHHAMYCNYYDQATHDVYRVSYDEIQKVVACQKKQILLILPSPIILDNQIYGKGNQLATGAVELKTGVLPHCSMSVYETMSDENKVKAKCDVVWRVHIANSTRVVESTELSSLRGALAELESDMTGTAATRQP